VFEGSERGCARVCADGRGDGGDRGTRGGEDRGDGEDRNVSGSFADVGSNDLSAMVWVDDIGCDTDTGVSVGKIRLD